MNPKNLLNADALRAQTTVLHDTAIELRSTARELQAESRNTQAKARDARATSKALLRARRTT